MGTQTNVRYRTALRDPHREATYFGQRRTLVRLRQKGRVGDVSDTCEALVHEGASHEDVRWSKRLTPDNVHRGASLHALRSRARGDPRALMLIAARELCAGRMVDEPRHPAEPCGPRFSRPRASSRRCRNEPSLHTLRVAPAAVNSLATCCPSSASVEPGFLEGTLAVPWTGPHSRQPRHPGRPSHSDYVPRGPRGPQRSAARTGGDLSISPRVAA
jgi:hypothetical protein